MYIYTYTNISLANFERIGPWALARLSPEGTISWALAGPLPWALDGPSVGPWRAYHWALLGPLQLYQKNIFTYLVHFHTVEKVFKKGCRGDRNHVAPAGVHSC